VGPRALTASRTTAFRLARLLLFSDTPQRLGKIRCWDASETDTIDRTMYQIRGTTSTVT
jgi:hypothetical protein